MNKNTKPAATHTLGARSYESPAINIVEVLSEGVLCASGQLEGWGDEEIDNSSIWG